MYIYIKYYNWDRTFNVVKYAILYLYTLTSQICGKSAKKKLKKLIVIGPFQTETVSLSTLLYTQYAVITLTTLFLSSQMKRTNIIINMHSK